MRNFIVKSRNPFSTIVEMFVPVIVILLLWAIRTAVSDTNKPNQQFISDVQTFYPGNGSNSFYNYRIVNSIFPFTIAFVGNGNNQNAVQSVKSAFSSTFPVNMPTVYFNTESDLNNYIGNSQYSLNPSVPGLFAAIIFNTIGSSTTGSQNWDYKIMMNSSDSRGNVGPQKCVPNTLQTVSVNAYTLDQDSSTWNMYINQGYGFLQTWLEGYIVQKTTGYSTLLQHSVVSFPTVAHISDQFVNIIGIFLGLLYTMAYVWPVTRLISGIVEEKESRMKETMFMMGLRPLVYHLSWFITYAIMFATTSILIAIVAHQAIFPKSDGSLVFLYFWLFGCTVYAYSMLMSVFFTRARVASIIGAVIFFLSFFPYFAVSDALISTSNKELACLSAPVCFALGVTAISNLEAFQQGLTYSTAGSVINNFSVNITFGFFILDVVIYLLLAFYLEAVLPSTYGVSRHPLFFIQWLWKKESVLESNQNDTPNPNVDELPPDVRKTAPVKIRNLVKEFTPASGSKVVAVNNLSVEMLEGQIFALLGHNGAGKTTTIHMLTGLYQPTSGSAEVYGKSIITDMSSVRHNLGVCPQHDVLFPILTVRETLCYFARLKGLDEDQIDQSIFEIVSDLSLMEKMDAPAGTLSGGQKRKLSLGVALIAGSKVVFLDEPTSGMDPYARRATWELLRQGKRGRVIVLTTHFMDEADYLGDRIAIMSSGELRCCGSSLFLKSRYGVGYSLTLTKAENMRDDSKAQTLLMQHVPTAELVSHVAGELSFRLPFAASGLFEALFRKFDEDKAGLGLLNYGMSVTTLEEVFLRVARDQVTHEEDKEGKLLDAMASTHDVVHSDAVLPVYEAATVSAVPRQMYALFVKRMLYASRDIKLFLWTLIYPFIVILCAVGLLSVILTAFPTIDMTTFQYNSPMFLPTMPTDVVFGAVPPVSLNTSYPSAWAGLEANGGNVIPFLVNAGTGCNGSMAACAPDSMSCCVNTNMSAYLLNSYLDPTQHPIGGGSRFGAYSVAQFNPANSTTVNEITIFVNTSSTHAYPIFLNLWHNALLQRLTGNADASLRISAHMQPFPLTSSQKALSSYLIPFLVNIGFSCIPAAFAAFIVRERETKTKHQQFISGVSATAYWIANFLWDFVNFLFPALLLLVIYASFSPLPTTFLSSYAGVTLLNLFMLGMSMIPFTYAFSFLFHEHSNAQNVTLFIHIILGAFLLIISTVLDFISSTQSANSVLKWFYRLFPLFCFGEIGNALVSINTASTQSSGAIPDIWSMKQTGNSFVMMFVDVILYWIVVAICEFFIAFPAAAAEFGKIFSPPPPAVQLNVGLTAADEDPDVAAERSRVQGGVDDVVQVKGLTKLYASRMGQPPKLAVRNLWFGVPKGEVFGFLGINGAGKTTSLQMLTGDEIPTNGSATLAGFDMLTQQTDLRKRLGYCPQFDAVLDMLTAREHLTLFARIKGIPEAIMSTYVESMITRIGLSEYANKPCSTYSGGNKRKLSVGIALIGDPEIVFLDEPSTGMDPNSRRFMWNVITSAMKGRAVILTTHSMEEAEALCARIGIMVGGRLRCLGSSQHLRSRYGDGYQLDFNTSDGSKAVRQFFREKFPSSTIVEKHEQSVKLRMPRAISSLGALFGLIEGHRTELNIVEYSVSETSLEQIFIGFAKQQDEEAANVAGIADANMDHDLDELRLGDRVRVLPTASQAQGAEAVVVFVGQTQFDPNGVWIGLQLNAPLGLNDGSINGVRYFNAPNKCGMFVRRNVLARM